jgi:hypothetical protein
MKELLIKLIRAVLLVTAVLGVFISLGGLAATLGGGMIALPGLGIIIAGPLVIILGLVIALGSVALRRLLAPPRPFR